MQNRKIIKEKGRKIKRKEVQSGSGREKRDEVFNIDEKDRILTKKDYFTAIGRRKTATARIRLCAEKNAKFLVNAKAYDVYFPTFELQYIARSALEKADCFGKITVYAIVKGGGIKSQAEAVRHGIARALVSFNPDFKKILKHAGFLTRDPRMRERKKFGLKRARRAPQWQKR